MAGLDFSLSLGNAPGAEPAQTPEIENVVIIGGGPAGLTAALYAGRAALNPLVLLGQSPGGQAATTELMENYPGFPEGVGGAALAQQMQRQAEQFGARVELDEVLSVDFSVRPFKLTTYVGERQAHAVIVATGAQSRHLGVPGEAKFVGRGVSFCATCDGFFYRDKDVIVVGGGDSALDEGLFLTRFARQVTVVHRRDTLRAGKTLQSRAFANPKMKFVWNTVIEEVLGDTGVTGARVRNVQTGEESVIAAHGIFVYVGLTPNSQLFKGQLELDEQGYIMTDKQQHTNIPGVYAAGDVQDPLFRQAVIAAGTGAAAAIAAERFLAEEGIVG